MSQRLREIAAKLDGADERLHKLKKKVERGAVTDLLEISTYRDAEGQVCVRVEQLLDVPQKWHIWMGECVHNARSALDRIAYGLNVAGGRREPPLNEERSQFPLYDCRSRFNAMAADTSDRCMIRYFPARARAFVESIQPYRAGEDSDLADTAQWLGVLAQLSNIDKHRHFPITGVYPGFITIPGTVEGHKVVDSDVPYKPLKPGTDLMRLKVPDLPEGVEKPQVNFRYSCELQFEGKEAQPPLPLVLEQEPVDIVLEGILTAIRQSVLPALKPLLK